MWKKVVFPVTQRQKLVACGTWVLLWKWFLNLPGQSEIKGRRFFGWREAREILRVVHVGFGLTSYWMRKGSEFFKLVKLKQMWVIILDTTTWNQYWTRTEVNTVQSELATGDAYEKELSANTQLEVLPLLSEEYNISPDSSHLHFAVSSHLLKPSFVSFFSVCLIRFERFTARHWKS